jgi:cell division protein FtsB
MSNRTFPELNIFDKAFMIWLGGGCVLLLILGLIGSHLPLPWVGIWVIIGFGFVGESEHKKIVDLKREVQKLEGRIDRLEKRS